MRPLLICFSLIICAMLVPISGTASRSLSRECPTINVETASDIFCPAANVKFAASVEGDVQGQPKFHWTISAGKIKSGQGTRTITVATADEFGYSVEDVTATVEVSGLDASCAYTASRSARISPFCPGHKVDEYGELSFDEEKARLEGFISRLQSETDKFGLIIVCPKAYGRAGEAETRGERARSYLVNERGIEADRVITKISDSHEALSVELWLMPAKLPPAADAPPANSGEPKPDSDLPKPAVP